uniref:Solute carrier family 2, facilitated glucose transporter member 1-like n=1 Tax=Saccoglossus kowalevskii TaxID=10224 RepID=A0ABM0MDZ0_SACKO
MVVTLCAHGQYGYNVAVLPAPTEYMLDFYNQSYTSRYGEISESTLDWLWALTAASFAVGGAIGSISAPTCSEILGRKLSLLLMNVFSISAGLMFGASINADNFELVIMGRVIIGFYCGEQSGVCVAMSIVPLFLSEISPNEYRGIVGAGQKINLAVGIVLAQCIGIFWLNTEDTWNILLALTAVFSILHLVFFPPCPESPRWSIISDRDEKNATYAIRKYIGKSAIQRTVNEIVVEHREVLQEDPVGYIALFKTKEYRLPLLICATVMSSVQFCGLPAIYQYAASVFEMIWPNNPDAVDYGIVGMGLTELVASVLAVFLIDRYGRRPLLLYSQASMVVFNGILTLSLNLS